MAKQRSDSSRRNAAGRKKSLDKTTLQAFFDFAPEGLLVMEDGAVVACNDRLAGMLGLSGKDEILDRGLSIFGEAGEEIARELSACKTGTVKRKWLQRTADGREIHIEGTFECVMIGTTRKICAVVADISEKYQNQRQILAERDLALMLAAAPSLNEALLLCLDTALRVSEVDVGGIYLFNEETGRMELAASRGMPRDPSFLESVSFFEKDSELVKDILAGSPLYRRYEEMAPSLRRIIDDEGIVATAHIPILHQGRVIACFSLISRSCAEIPLAIRHGLETIAAQVGIVIARLRAEEREHESENLYRAIFENTGTAIGIINSDLTILLGNREMERLTGFTKLEVEGKRKCTDFYGPLDNEKLAVQHERRMVDGDTGLRPYELGLICKDGFVKRVYMAVTMIPETRNSVVSMLDITDIRKAEEALRQSEEKYRILVENAHDAIFITQGGFIKFPNPKTEKMFGYTALELGAISYRELIAPGEREKMIERQERKSRGEILPSSFSLKIRNRQASTIPVEINEVDIIWEGKPATLNIMRDVSLQKKLEAELLHSQKLEAIGTLAGGIAHDFNNILTGIQGHATLMLFDTDLHHPFYTRLKGIEDLIMSGADLTRQLLGFARKGKYEVARIDLNSVIRKVANMFGRARKEISVSEQLHRDLWAVEADPGQIEQVLMNLLVNSWQAMPAGGEIAISTSNVEIGSDHGMPFKVKPGKYVKVSVSDTGTGMDEFTCQRIFEPFFTTKEMGRGTGLGLATVYGIVKGHEGIINVRSKIGKGTTFDIYLPGCGEVQDASRPENVPKRIPGGSETILLVDDEPSNLEVNSDLLESLGYRVETAASGREAVRIYEEKGEAVDLVVLDMVMPGMGGTETFKQLKKMNPGVRVLLSSGYSIDGPLTGSILQDSMGFLQKPFQVQVLAEKIREILDGAMKLESAAANL